MDYEKQLKAKIEQRFHWYSENGKHILYLDLSEASEDEFIGATYLITAKLDESMKEDLRFLVNLERINYTPKMIYRGMQLARYQRKKVQRIAALGFGPVLSAFYRAARLRNPTSRVFKTFNEAMAYLRE
jgi:hypothetical protein